MENNYNQKDFLRVLIKLIYLIDYKDSYTKLHSENVAKYAELIGKELKLENNDIEILKIGGLLHDIGKIGIPDYILVKSTNLTDSEYEIMKKHVIIAEALFPKDGYEEIKKMIRNHHERIDGKGYPDGLKGSEISYFTRIISIADTFDAMTTQRSYNKIKTSDEAIEELIKSSTKQLNPNGEIIQQLDPHLVNTFIKAIKKDTNLMEKFQQNDLIIINNRNKGKSKK